MEFNFNELAYIMMSFKLVDYFKEISDDDSFSRYEICKLASYKTLQAVLSVVEMNLPSYNEESNSRD